MNLDQSAKIELIVSCATKCADLLKNPNGDAKTMTAEERQQTREDAYDDLLTCIETLSAIATYNEGIFDIINIASKLHVQPEK